MALAKWQLGFFFILSKINVFHTIYSKVYEGGNIEREG